MLIKRINKCLISIFILTTYISCVNENEYIITKLPAEKQLKCQSYDDIQLITRFPAFIEQYNGRIIVFNPFEESSVFAVFNEKTGQQIISYGQRGKGPDEFFTPMINRWIRKSNELFVYDPNLLLFYILEFSDSTIIKRNEIGLPSHINKYGNILMIHQNLYAGTTLHQEGKIELFDNKGNILSTASYNPIKTHIDFEINSIMAYNEESGLLIVAGINIGFLAGYKINVTQPDIKSYWENYFSDVILTNNNNKTVLDETKCLAGFTELKFSGNKIFALYKGKEIIKYYGRSKEALPGNLLVFESNGEIISNYSFECPLLRFSVIESNHKLIGITLEQNFKLVYYNLPEEPR